jgi:hypothetical protein
METRLTIDTRDKHLPTLPPKRPDETQTAWEDPWAAAASARQDLGPETPYGAEDLNARAVGRAITTAINADPAEVKRLRQARQEAREGKTRPWRDTR